MFEKIKNIFIDKSSSNKGEEEKGSKRKIENIVFLIILLVITVIVINSIWENDNDETKKQADKILAQTIEQDIMQSQGDTEYYSLQSNLEQILQTIQGVGKVKVLINYAETSTTVAVYNETKTESITEEKDTQGGIRNVTQTDTQKEIAYNKDGTNSSPITEKVVMPTIEGAIITAQGASNANTKANIISATQAVTGLATHKIQVFQMKEN